MKKHLKRLAVTVTVLFAFLGAGFSVAFASGYINWNGTEDFNQLMANFDLFRTEGIEIIKDRDAVIAEKEAIITEKENKIAELEGTTKADKDELARIRTDVGAIITNANGENGKGGKFDVLQRDVNKLAKSLEIESTVNAPNEKYEGKNAQLEQAEKDMKAARDKSDALLEELKKIPEVKPESTDK